MGWQPTYRAEARIYANYILTNHPNAKVGLLYQNDDFGKDYIQGLKDGLGDKFDRTVIVSAPYDVGTPTVDSEVVAIRTAKPDVFINIATPKYAAQAIRKVAELDWHPIHIMTNVSTSIGGVIKPAGMKNAEGILTALYNMDVTDPQWDSYPGMQRFRAFLAKYYPEADKSDAGTLAAYNLSTGLVEVLKGCGDNLTRENVMKVAANLDFEVETLRPGIRVKTSPTDFYPVEQMRMSRFNGEHWEGFGPIMDSHIDQVALSIK
jgi:ABC-type branched-subunit amino acid transport system substrate-binding protein